MSEDIHKWTDGRYTLMFDEHTFFVFDNEKEEQMIALEVTKKLNEQQATINEYKENWDNLVEKASEISKRNVVLDEEIGQLQRENEKLKKENRALKKDLNKLYNLLIDKGMSHNELQDVLW